MNERMVETLEAAKTADTTILLTVKDGDCTIAVDGSRREQVLMLTTAFLIADGKNENSLSLMKDAADLAYMLREDPIAKALIALKDLGENNDE
jgi:hypothetical protein